MSKIAKVYYTECDQNGLHSLGPGTYVHTHTNGTNETGASLKFLFSKCTKYPTISSVNWTRINYLAFDFNFKQTIVYTGLRQQSAQKQWVYL